MRPANIVTSVADVLAGATIAGFFGRQPPSQTPACLAIGIPVSALALSTIGLYGGGVVFNDVFDAELDAIERPERPIPSGLIKRPEAALLGTALLILGILSAFAITPLTGGLAALIALAALVYDKWGKQHTILGPLNMGLCRGLNLLLGISVLPAALAQHGAIALVPVLYIASITMISRGEVHGSGRNLLYFAAGLYAIVIGCIGAVATEKDTVLLTLPFLLFFAWMIFRPLAKAIQEPIGKNIGRAVKAGVIALILMNASWAAAFDSLYLALIIVLLLPLSLWLARLFAVT